MTKVYLWKNNRAGEWEQISYKAFYKARCEGAFEGRYFTKLPQSFEEEEQNAIFECTEEQYRAYQKQDRHTRYLQEQQGGKIVIAASQMDEVAADKAFVDAEENAEQQAIDSLHRQALAQAFAQLCTSERALLLAYYDMELPNATALAKSYGISRQAVDKRIKKIEEKIKKLVAISEKNGN